jgi:predicted nuclease of restriction endonuclease-like (RecB) superfamily
VFLRIDFTAAKEISFNLLLINLVILCLNHFPMTQNLSVDKQYKKWIVEVKERISTAQIKAALTVNRQLMELYWELGREIYEKQQSTKWGESLIEQMAKDLSSAFPGMKGFSRRNLFYIKKWYDFYRDVEIIPQTVGQMDASGKVQQVVALIPWGHNILIIMRCKDISEALFYIKNTVDNNWSRAILQAQMESRLYQRSGQTINNFSSALVRPQADLARETLKNPYNFDFLMMGKDAQERDLERALTNHIQKFMLELGHGFAYMGRQFHLNVGGEDFYLDLLFYHTRLRCYVVVELKATEFKPEYAGKLNFYLNVVNAKLRHEQDQPSIGILLCKTPNKMVVEYALENISGPLGVAGYEIMDAVPENLKGELPSLEELEQGLVEPMVC